MRPRAAPLSCDGKEVPPRWCDATEVSGARRRGGKLQGQGAAGVAGDHNPENGAEGRGRDSKEKRSREKIEKEDEDKAKK